MPNDLPKVTFDELSRQVEAYIENSNRTKPGRTERWSFVIALLAAGLGMLAGQLIGGPKGLAVIQASLVVECLAFLVALWLAIRREWKEFAYAHRAFAENLDRDYATYHEYVVWLRQFSDEEIGRRLRYVRDRKQMMSYRLGVFTGGIERLGIFPVLVVLYLQFKDWTFGDWGALGNVHMVGGLLLWALLLGYVMGWFLIRLRTRLDVYESLLAERLQPGAERP
jgi:hypothetical protein